MKRKYLFIFYQFVVSLFCQGQTIRGVVIDAVSKSPLPFANVFFNNSSEGTVTDNQGRFAITNITSGSRELVVSFTGYNSYNRFIDFKKDGNELNLGTIQLTASIQLLGTIEVNVAHDREWERKLKKFTNVFLGKTKNAKLCKIENPWVIDFYDDPAKTGFFAKVTAPLEITNRALGYKITYYLTRFWYHGDEYQIGGNVRFEALIPSSDAEASSWTKNRTTTYTNSINYLFKTLVNRGIRGKEFSLYSVSKELRESDIEPEKFRKLDSVDVAPFESQKNAFKIFLKGDFQITQRLKGQSKTSNFHVSNDYILVNRNGFVLNSHSLFVEGAYSYNRIPEMLPATYDIKSAQPNAEKDDSFFLKFQEKIYVHTDKPHYYPGETIWLKGYINYGSFLLRDSLSKVAYIELISPKDEIRLTKNIAIDSGFFFNDISLPDTLSAGTYYLRAYTNLNRNFGDENIYARPIVIFNTKDRIRYAPEKEVIDTQVEIASNKKVYKLREKIAITVKTLTTEGSPIVANLSVSVTDMNRVAETPDRLTIKDNFVINSVYHNQYLLFDAEKGIGFSGRFTNDRGKPEKTQIDIVQLKSKELYQANTNERGLFSFANITHYDTAMFGFKVANRSGKYGNVELVKRETPPIVFTKQLINFDKQSTVKNDSLGQDLLAEKFLKEVVVKGKRIKEETLGVMSEVEGKFFSGKDIDSQGPLHSVMKLVRVETDWATGVIGRRTRPGVSLTIPPLVPFQVSIDEFRLSQDEALFALTSIDPSDIEAMYVGEYTITIITNRFKGNGKTNSSPNFQYLNLIGFASPSRFVSPNYESKSENPLQNDYRTTLYWNPNLATSRETGVAKIEFYSADLVGKYRVVVEGVTEDGNPVRCVYFFDVNDQ